MILTENSPAYVSEMEFEKGAVKPEEEFRNYTDSFRHSVVHNHYRLMRTYQTLSFSEKMSEKYSFDKPRAKMTIKEAFRALEGYVDSSDPDVDLPNMVHMFQTAEGIRRAGHPDWMQVVGLIHDMGKIMYLWGDELEGQNGTADGSQWALGGDTWVVGCPIPSSVVFPEFNELNPDMNDSRYNSGLGMYQPHCGLWNLKFAYGHDEYLYNMLVANKCTIPQNGLAMIRFHSLYPWHTGGAYRELMTEDDHRTLGWVLEFNKFDLYTKDQKGISADELETMWEYYTPLLEKYGLSGELMW